MQHYLSQIQDVFGQLGSGAVGLSAGEAAKRLAQHGPNRLVEAKKDSFFKRILKQVMDPMILILIGAATVAMVLSFYEGHFPTDSVIIMAVVVINSLLGVYQESKAEAAIEALQKMSAATSRVLRDGELVVLKSEELVPGDVVLLEAGDAVPADARIFECASMQVEESSLTGESLPVTKLTKMLAAGDHGDVPLGDRKNMVYMGSTVVYGRGKAAVVATGMSTEMGKIADAIAQAEQGETPLQIKLAQLSKLLTWLVLGISVFIFGFSSVRALLSGEGLDGKHLLEFFMVAVSLAVAAIPEGLAAVVTIVLSIGVTNMSKKKAIIRRLTAVETLGCAQVICSDKTGTLTQNKMTVVEHYGADTQALATAMALCTDAEFNAEGEVIGEPTEAALVNWAKTLELNKPDLAAALPRAGEAPFDSMRKMMSTVHAKDGAFEQYTKGAPDEILSRCTRILTAQGEVAFTQAHKDEILAANKAMADKALRVLAAASRKYTQAPAEFSPAALESELCFVGLTGMIDPVRPEVKDAITECRSAGITPIMITGDHRDTAVAIANELGILADGKQAITGAQLSQISDEDFEATVENYAVYARVQPEHKVRIVKAWQAKGCVTAMTGDGVNDAPSIKSADIGIGMGITGTDVTKNVADMVLADDNFATIVQAVGAGRRIYNNIRKAIQFLLGSNLSEVISVFTASILGVTILKPVHLLWINLVTDSFPALALGMEKPEHDIMLKKPRGTKDGVFAGGVGFDIFYQGLFVSVLTILAFFLGEFWHHGNWHFMADLSKVTATEGMTMAFLTMSMAEMFHSFNMRSQRGSLFTMTRKSGMNWWLVGSFAASLFMSTIVVAFPLTREIFSFSETFTVAEYFASMGLAFAIIPLVETVKLIQRALSKR